MEQNWGLRNTQSVYLNHRNSYRWPRFVTIMFPAPNELNKLIRVIMHQVIHAKIPTAVLISDIYGPGRLACSAGTLHPPVYNAAYWERLRKSGTTPAKKHNTRYWLATTMKNPSQASNGNYICEESFFCGNKTNQEIRSFPIRLRSFLSLFPARSNVNGAVMYFLSVEAFTHALMLLYTQTSEFYLEMVSKHK